MMKEFLEEVGDNDLVDITKVNVIGAEIDVGRVDEVGGVVVVMVYDGQASTGSHTL